MADNLTLSMASGCDFKPKMPPGYEAGHSESEDSISPPASPTPAPIIPQAIGQNRNQSGTGVDGDTDGGGEHDDGKKTSGAERGDVGIVNGIFNGGEDNTIYRQLPLPVGDVVTDGAGEKNSLPLKKGVVDKGVQERKRGVKTDAMDGGAQGNKDDIMVVENGTSSVKSQGHLNQSKEKALTIKSRDVSEENVHGLIDDMEEVMGAMSTGEERAADRLVAILKIFFPFVLCILNELTTLRVKVKDFILENRSLQKEVRHLKKEIEERDAKDANIGRQPTICPVCDPTSSSGEPSQSKGASAILTIDVPQKHDEPVKKELRKIRSQNKELQRVNHSWEKYCKKLSVKHEIDLKKKTAQLAASDERRKELEKRLDDKFKDYDQTLLHARHSEGQHRVAAEQYKQDRDALRKKYDEMTTQLREWIKEREQKDKEIQRLNQVVERQSTQKASSKPTRLAEEGCAGHTKPSKRVVPREMVNDPALFLYVNIDEVEEKTRKEKQQRASTSRPRSPRTPPAEDNPMTLPKDELKDQVELYRQQIDVFRADFIQERRDREKAAGQVDTLKKELEKTKKKLETMQQDRFEHDVYGLGQDYVPRRQREQQKLRGGGNTGYGRQYAFQNYVDPGNHVYSVIED